MKVFKTLVFSIILAAVFISQPVLADADRYFQNENNSVLIDKKTDLMWASQDNGTDISWSEGKEYCANFRLEGYTDWRMPTQEELATLYHLEAAESSDYFIMLKIKITACCLWATEMKQDKVASFDFEYGYQDWRHPLSTVETRVLPVRSAK